jgi:transposase InsO family protein
MLLPDCRQRSTCGRIFAAAMSLTRWNEYGCPKTIRLDNGPEFVSRELNLLAFMRGVTLDFSRPGKPTDKAFIESLNGKFRAEHLNAHWFRGSTRGSENARLGVEILTPCPTPEDHEALFHERPSFSRLLEY